MGQNMDLKSYSSRCRLAKNLSMLLNCHKLTHYHNVGSFCSCFLSGFIEMFHTFSLCCERSSSNHWRHDRPHLWALVFFSCKILAVLLRTHWLEQSVAGQRNAAGGLWLGYRVRKTENLLVTVGRWSIKPHISWLSQTLSRHLYARRPSVFGLFDKLYKCLLLGTTVEEGVRAVWA